MLQSSFNVFLWLIFLFGLSFVLDNFWKRIFSGKKYRFFLAPGVMVHELSHAFACRIVGAKIEEINFFSWQGGYVKYLLPKTHRFARVLSEMFIGFAPILGGIGALLFFSWFLGLQFFSGIVNFHESSLFFHGFWAAIQEIPSFIGENWLSWQFWLFIYLIISITVCLVPSKRDIKNSLGGVLVIFILGLIFYYLDFFPQFLGTIFNPHLGNILVSGAMLGFLALIFTLPIYLIRFGGNLWKRF